MSGKEDIIKGVDKLLRKKFGSTTSTMQRRLFDEYDQDGDGNLTPAELDRLFADADVGSWATRSMYVRGTIERMDSNHDAKLSWAEYRAAMGIV